MTVITSTYLDFGEPALSVSAHDIDQMRLALGVGGALFAIAVLGLCAYCLVRFRRPAGALPEGPVTTEGGRSLAFGVASVVVLVTAAFGAGLAAYAADTVPPESALGLAGHQSDSLWTFTYPNGDTQNDKVIVPLGRPVTLDLATDDDPNTFVVPELRVRTPLVAGAVSTLFLEPRALGTAHVIGPKGSAVAEIQVVSTAAFDAYMREGPTNPYCPSPDACPAELAARWGTDLFAQNACIGCHSRDGSRLVGPSFKGVYGRDETMTTGLVVHIDEAYIRESIRKPQAKIVKGFENAAMPSFANLSDRKVDALIAYLKTVK